MKIISKITKYHKNNFLDVLTYMHFIKQKNPFPSFSNFIFISMTIQLL